MEKRANAGSFIRFGIGSTTIDTKSIYT